MELRLLGPLEAVGERGERVELGGPKQRALLVALLLERGSVVPVDRLVECLWGDAPPKSAMGTLQAYVSNLRRALEPDRDPGAPSTVLVTRPPGYLLDIDASHIDITRFERLVEEGEAALDDGAYDLAAARLREALALWRGPALAEVAYESFAQGEINRLEELRLAAQEAWAEAELRAGHHNDVAAELTTLVAQHPLRSRLRAHLMLALYRSGRQADALRVYQEGRTLVRAELGTDPEPELQELEDQILLQSPALDWQPPAAVLVEPVVTSPPAEAVPDSGGSAAVLVGRDAEVSVLERALIESASGSGRLVLVAGEAGIGKTRLAEAAIARARERGALVAWGRCHQGEGAPAFWPWTQAVRALVAQAAGLDLSEAVAAGGPALTRVVPELSEGGGGAEVAGEDARFAASDAVRLFLARLTAATPAVVVIDDVQWADAASLRLLQLLAGEVRSSRLLLLVTMRDEGRGEAAALADVLATVAREPAAERLALSGLDEGEVGRLASDALGTTLDDALIHRLHERTGGNPFFVGEVVRWLQLHEDVEQAEREVPAGVRDVIRHRLAALPDGVEKLLGAAAVIGREFDVSVTANVAGVEEGEALDLLEAAGAARLVEEGARVGRFRFVHALVREALLAGLSGPRRLRSHARVVTALEEIGDPAVAVEVAWHALAAVPVVEPERALTLVRGAADATRRQLAFEEAARLCERGLAVMAQHRVEDDAQWYELQLQLGRARRRMNDQEGARAALREALGAARRLEDGGLFARAALSFSGGAWWGWWSDVGFADEEAITLLEEALERLPEEPSVARSLLLGRLAVQLYFVPGAEQRRDELSATALDMARGLDDHVAQIQGLGHRHVAIWAAGNAAERQGLAAEMVRLSKRARWHETELLSRALVSVAAIELGDIGPHDALYEGRRTEVPLSEPALTANLAWGRSMRAMLDGRLDDAEKLIDENLAITARWSAEEALRTYSAQLLALRWDQGRMGELEEPARRGLATEALVYPWRTALTLILASSGKTDEAREQLDLLMDDGYIDRFPNLGWLFYVAARAEAVCLLEDEKRALLLAEKLLPFVDVNILFFTRLVFAGPVAYHAGSLLTIAHRHDEAEPLLADAIARCRRLGARGYLYRAQTRLGACLLHKGEPERARPHLEQAAAGATEIGMAAIAAEATNLHGLCGQNRAETTR